MRWFDKYKGLVRRIKFGYRINTLLNYGKVRNNKRIYQKYGLKRSVTAPISHRILSTFDLKSVPDQPRIDIRATYFGYPYSDLKSEFDDRGFVVLRGIFKTEANRINEEIDRLKGAGLVDFNFTGNKIVFANKESVYLDDLTRMPELVDLLSALLEWPVHPFQTINFLYGSEQAAHSDSIHMSTYPEGKLTAVWIALEDIGKEQGPLFYYPGSHKLPYIYNEDLGLKETVFLLDENPNKKYEEVIAATIKREGLAPELFLPEQGDVLIWHPNLLHGGSLHANRSLGRKSMVIHYFGKEVICYHELTQRPAIF